MTLLGNQSYLLGVSDFLGLKNVATQLMVAVLALLAVLFGTLLAGENKIMEFRHEWRGDLKKDFDALILSVNALFSVLNFKPYCSQWTNEIWIEAYRYYRDIALAIMRIRLQLKSWETSHNKETKNFILILDILERACLLELKSKCPINLINNFREKSENSDREGIESDPFEGIEDDFKLNNLFNNLYFLREFENQASNILARILEIEWRQIKRGEPMKQVVTTMFIVVLSLFLANAFVGMYFELASEVPKYFWPCFGLFSIFYFLYFIFFRERVSDLIAKIAAKLRF